MTFPDQYVTAIYKDTGIRAYKGNPFIEALPPLMNLKQLKVRLRGTVDFDLADIQADGRKRAHMISGLLDDFFQPLAQHVHLEERISTMIRRGYVGRNLNDGSLSTHLQNGYERIMTGDLDNFRFAESKSTARSLSLIGCSGSGKSSTLERILNTYPQVIYHPQQNFFQLSYLKIECPNNGSLKSLCLNFFRGIDRVLGTKYESTFVQKRHGQPTLLALMSQIANQRAIGVLVIDEIQRLSQRRSGGRETMMEFFVELVNTVGIPVVLVGTPKARPIFESELQSARRSAGIGAILWEPVRLDSAQSVQEWKAFTNKLWKYQWLKRRDVVLTEEIRDCWYDLSQGVLDIVVKLFVLAQLRAVITGCENITVELLKAVYHDELKPVHPMLAALRANDHDLIYKYSDLRLDNTDKRLLELQQQVMQLPKDNEPERLAGNEQALRLYNLLLAMDCKSELLEPLVEKIFNERPELTIREMLPIILEWYEEDKSGVVKTSIKGKRTRQEDWHKEANDDLRYIFSCSEDMYEPLKKQGLVINMESWQ